MRTYAVRLVALLALLVVGGLAAPSAALASCAGRTPSQVVADSDVVLTGRLSAVDDPGGASSPHVETAAGSATASSSGASLPGATPPAVDGSGPWWSTPVGMVTLGLVGLLVVTFGGLALAVGLGLLAGRRRGGTDGSDAGTEPHSTGTPFK